VKRFRRTRRVLRWIGNRLKDVFYDTDNLHLDLARVMVFVSIVGELGAAYHNMRLKQPIDLGPSGLGGGLGTILTAGAGLLAAKAWSKKKSRESAAIAQNTKVAVKAGDSVVPAEAVTP
jgi:hypothetical protein